MVELAVNIYTEIVTYALPVAIIFEVCNLAVSTFMRVAFGGKLWFGK